MADKPNFSFEKKYWEKGYIVIGVDEVGRGAAAGPVVAAATSVITTKRLKDCLRESSNLGTVGRSLDCARDDILNLGIDDSKRLSRKRREELEPLIKKYFYFGIGEAGVEIINKRGIVYATRLAMKRAIRECKSGWNCHAPIKSGLAMTLLIDGRIVKGIGNQEAIIKGDQKSISIAAASIIAKVYRDSLMRKLGKKYIDYGFEDHVGYGTKKHAEMIRQKGLCPIHRIIFVESLLERQ